jgi:hypothetical protein
MLIREFPGTEPNALQRLAGQLGDGAELFVRDDGTGSVMLCGDDDIAPEPARADKRVELRFTGGRYGADAGSWLFYVGLWAPDDYRDEFLAWYKLEHLPILLESPLWDGCRFFEERTGRGAQFYALHQLAERRALDSVERKHSRATPWFRRLSTKPWFDGAFERTLCRRMPA